MSDWSWSFFVVVGLLTLSNEWLRMVMGKCELDLGMVK